MAAINFAIGTVADCCLYAFIEKADLTKSNNKKYVKRPKASNAHSQL